MTVKPKYYFNLDGNISDGEKEYSLENIEDRIGGLSISSDLKDNYVLYGRNSLLDLINNLNEENEQLKAQLLYDGDGVCNICQHQYLVETEKYYVGKCKKGHEECSKVDLQYCEDFELMRDYE